MADQEEPRSTTTSRLSHEDNNNSNNDHNNNNKNINGQDQDQEMRQEGWLRLSIGHDHEEVAKPDLDHLQQQQTEPMARRDSFLELNLFSGGGSSRQEEEASTSLPLPSSSIFHHPLRPDHHHHHEMIGSWSAFRTQPSSSSSSVSLMMPFMGPYFGRSNYQNQLIGINNQDHVVAGPSSSFQVIDPPRRSHSGVWFLLQASQNQTREPFLPQIPKSYLRIKDGKMTVRILMKYLVNKLRLEHESQVEIRCKGQELEPMLTLEHVRDTIWRLSSGNSNRDNNTNPYLSQNLTLLPNSSSTSDHHLMVLHYGRPLS
ncbi:unnamed protein product [Cochlearia groenlandica]